MRDKIREIRDKYCKCRYDDLFKQNIAVNGNFTYISNLVENFKQEENKYSCIVKGTKNYNVSVTLDKDGNYIEGTCECPYYEEDIHCKHIYALLKTIETENMKKELMKLLSKIKKNINQIFLEIDEINNNYEDKVKNKVLKQKIKNELEKRHQEYDELITKIEDSSITYNQNYTWNYYKLLDFEEDLKKLKKEIETCLKNRLETEEENRIWREECKIDDLELIELIEAKKRNVFKHAKKSYIENRINELIECSDDIEELNLCRKLMEKYHYDTKIISKRIIEAKKEREIFEENYLKPLDDFCYAALDHLSWKEVDNVQRRMNVNGADTKWIDEYKKLRKKREYEESVQQLKAASQQFNFGILKGLLLFSGIFSALGDSDKPTKEDISFLSPWEQEAYKSGDFDLWDFEEEEMDEESYHYEDD